MNSFDTIVNPHTNRRVSIYSQLGRSIIKQYVQSAGDSQCTEYHGQPVKCQASPDCYYTAASVKGETGVCKRYSGKNVEEGKDRMRSSEKLVKQFETDAATRLQKAFQRKKLNERLSKKKEPVIDCNRYNLPERTLTKQCIKDTHCKIVSGKNKKKKSQRRCVRKD